MMEDQLDLNINNYNFKELEQFFQLTPNKKYTAGEIEMRGQEMREVLLKSGNVSKKFKKELVDFLETAKRWLIHVKCPVAAPTSLPKNPRLDSSTYPVELVDRNRLEEMQTRPEVAFIHTMNSEFQQGSLNPLATRTITKCVSIDSRFRDNFYGSQSSDFTVQIPTKLGKVVSMQLSSLELPISFYGISSALGNNTMKMTLVYRESEFLPVMEETKQIIVPDGNYNGVDLIKKVNELFSPQLITPDTTDDTDLFSGIKFILDVNESGSGTGKVRIVTNGLRGEQILDIILDFARDERSRISSNAVGNPCRLGWNLGFLREKYEGATNYVAETIIEPATIRYVYLAIDDFNNSVNNHFMAIYNGSILNPNILARISVKGNYFGLIMENDLNIVSEPRKYFGPVDIQRLRIQLFDDMGKHLDMNGANFSFCLVFKMLYDL